MQLLYALDAGSVQGSDDHIKSGGLTAAVSTLHDIHYAEDAHHTEVGRRGMQVGVAGREAAALRRRHQQRAALPLQLRNACGPAKDSGGASKAWQGKTGELSVEWWT